MFLREDSNQRATRPQKDEVLLLLSPGGVYTPYFLLSVSYCH